jgi:hypothetical protein
MVYVRYARTGRGVEGEKRGREDDRCRAWINTGGGILVW